MDTAVITGAFTLGGVVIGGGLDWVRASLAARRAAARERDELIAAIDSACIALMTETLTWRALDTRKRQEELRAAIGQLRRARDAADAPFWRRRRPRRNIRPALPPA